VSEKHDCWIVHQLDPFGQPCVDVWTGTKRDAYGRTYTAAIAIPTDDHASLLSRAERAEARVKVLEEAIERAKTACESEIRFIPIDDLDREASRVARKILTALDAKESNDA